MGRFFVEASKKAEFESAFQAGAPDLGAHIAPRTYAGGWRIDKEGDDEEFVLLTGWNKVEDHYAFKESDVSERFRKIKGAVRKSEVKHGRLEKWE